MRAAALVARVVVLVCAVQLAGCAGGFPPRDGPSNGAIGSGGADAPRTIATGLEAPWSIAFHGVIALISERDSGRILEVVNGGSGDDGTPRSGAVREVGTVPGVAAQGEGGLLGIAVREGQLYAFLSATDENRIVRFPVTGDAGGLGLGDPETVLAGIPVAAVHNGGRIAFGPDGMLYATTGDGGVPQRAQDPASLAGKILRMTPDGGVPGDNPFAGSPVYTLGHRNPQGIAWAEDGTMYASEFGQNTWDELNLIEAGQNYGWPEAEGIAGVPGFVDPVQQWAPAEASPSGIAIQGGAISIANLRGERLRSVPLADPGATAVERFAGELGRLRDAVAAPDGSLWILTNNTDGRGEPGPGDDRLLAVEPGSPPSAG